MMTQTPEVLDYASTHQRLFDAGYLPIPILPNTKRPARMDWANDAYHLAQGCHGYGVGILCGRGQGPIVAIDIDVLDESLAMEIAAHVTHTHGMTLSRVGLEPKIMLLYQAAEAGYRKLRSTEYGCGHIEVLGYGQQIVAFGKHPVTKKDYQWPGLLGSILEVPAWSLPVLTMDQIREVLKSGEQIIRAKGYQPKSLNEKPASATDYDPDDPLDQKPALGWTLDQARAFVDKLNPDASRDQWIQIGMALHHEFDGSGDAMEIWDSWSAKSSKYKEGEPESQWESFARPGFRGRPVTAAYILDLVKKAGHETKTPEQKTTELNFFKRLNWSTARFVDEPPPIPMVVENTIVKGIVGLFYSPGGAGKSTILLHLCIKIALARHHPQFFFGNQIHGGKVVIVTAEDPDVIINRRFVGCLQAIAAENNADYKDVRYLVDSGLSIVSTFGHCVQLFTLQQDGTLKTSNYYTSLLDALSEVEDLQMVVIDTKTRYSPGEGLGNVTATQEISYYEAIAQKLNATVMLLHHTDKASRRKGGDDGHAYRDASALYDSVRGAWLLRGLSEDELQAQGLTAADAGNYLMLKNDKNNYIQLHEPMLIQREGYSYSRQTIAPKLSNVEKKEAKVQAAFDIVLRLLQEQGEGVISQADVIRISREENLSRNKVITVLGGMLEDGLVETVPSKGRAVIYQLTNTGKTFNLSIGEN